MLTKLQMGHVGPAPHMELDLAPRLNLLTGDNGLGKSFVLDVAWWALSRTWAGEQALPNLDRLKAAAIKCSVHGVKKPSQQVASFDAQTWTWRLQRGRPAKPGLVLYARVDGGFSVWDPARNDWRQDAQRPVGG